jgi:hypothetical protein
MALLYFFPIVVQSAAAPRLRVVGAAQATLLQLAGACGASGVGEANVYR